MGELDKFFLFTPVGIIKGDWVVTCVASGSSSDISNMSGEEGQENTDILGVEEEAQGSFSREGI